MIRLLAPDPTRFDAWAACLDDFAGTAMDGSGFDEGEVPEPTRQAFEAYLESCRLAEDLAVAPPEGRVHCTFRWIVGDDWAAGGELLGFLAVRHSLTRFLLDQAGHIGYSVRPSARRRGVASAALLEGLALARLLGASPTLVCCAEGNEASRRTIEGAGGIHDGNHAGHRRYWFGMQPWPTSPTDPASLAVLEEAVSPAVPRS